MYYNEVSKLLEKEVGSCSHNEKRPICLPVIVIVLKVRCNYHFFIHFLLHNLMVLHYVPGKYECTNCDVELLRA